MNVAGSNEYTYRKDWSKFVDSAIARRTSCNRSSSSSGGSKGGKSGSGDAANFMTCCETDDKRVNLRDLMQLEEVLSRLQETSNDSRSSSSSRAAGETCGSEGESGSVRRKAWELEEAHGLKFGGGYGGGGEISGRLRSLHRWVFSACQLLSGGRCGKKGLSLTDRKLRDCALIRPMRIKVVCARSSTLP